jgi:hypothetical protein
VAKYALSGSDFALDPNPEATRGKIVTWESERTSKKKKNEGTIVVKFCRFFVGEPQGETKSRNTEHYLRSVHA